MKDRTSRCGFEEQAQRQATHSCDFRPFPFGSFVSFVQKENKNLKTN